MSDTWTPDEQLANQPVSRGDFYLVISKLMQANWQLATALGEMAMADPRLSGALTELTKLQREIGESIDRLVVKEEP